MNMYTQCVKRVIYPSKRTVDIFQMVGDTGKVIYAISQFCGNPDSHLTETGDLKNTPASVTRISPESRSLYLLKRSSDNHKSSIAKLKG